MFVRKHTAGVVVEILTILNQPSEWFVAPIKYSLI